MVITKDKQIGNCRQLIINGSSPFIEDSIIYGITYSQLAKVPPRIRALRQWRPIQVKTIQVLLQRPFLGYRFRKRIIRAPTLRQSYIGGRYMGLKLYKSSRGGVFLVFRLFYFIVSIEQKTDLGLVREWRIVLLIVATVLLQIVKIVRPQNVWRLVYAYCKRVGE